MQEQRQEAEVALKEVEGGAGQGTRGTVDPGTLKREITRIDGILASTETESVRGKEKDALVKEEQRIEEEISVGMPTQYEMRQPTRNPGAVRKHMQWCKRNQLKIERYVEIQKILRPMEPKSIEVLRKEK